MAQEDCGHGDACGKAILFGEHFVVHGGRALAVPLPHLRTSVRVARGVGAADDVRVVAELDDVEPVARTVRRAAELLGLPGPWAVESRSEVPLGCGLGSSASFAVALVRGLCALAGRPASADEVSGFAWELEKIAHGTPSGVDNTVIAHERGICFVRGATPVPLRCGAPLHLVVADSGRRHPTAEAVGRVHAIAARDPEGFAATLAAAEVLVSRALFAFEAGDAPAVGRAMDENHALLASVDVSSPLLDRLVAAARAAGALGAKLTGAGVGGSVIALCAPPDAEAVRAALLEAGARAAFATTVGEDRP